ncbi:hypothetical protein F5887DRAFT_1285534 [Amanita rubescens]|nr:hypothetical protein F5887DRAFT_1286638 [Amanita rubescens]KAF8336012.1 hypothetical protein F5887DRAFT_1285534 [Amanita rubescens]
MSSYASPTPSSLFDRVHGTPSSVSSYNVNAPSLVAIPLPHAGQVPNLHYLLSNTCPNALKFNTAFPFHPSTCLPPNLNPAVNELASSPPLKALRLRVSAVNLVFDVTNPRGVLVADVFNAIFGYLQNPLSRDVYGSLPSHVREATDRAYHCRLQGASSRRLQGINQGLALVDCLGERMHFHSLTYSPSHGVWDVVLF